jgi:hypothetical protein
MALYTAYQKAFVIRTMYSSGGSCVVERNIGSFMFMLHHRETGLLSSLKKEEACMT